MVKFVLKQHSWIWPKVLKHCVTITQAQRAGREEMLHKQCKMGVPSKCHLISLQWQYNCLLAGDVWIYCQIFSFSISMNRGNSSHKEMLPSIIYQIHYFKEWKDWHLCYKSNIILTLPHPVSIERRRAVKRIQLSRATGLTNT